MRFAVAEKIVHAPPTTASRRADVVVDPLVMPIGALGSAGRRCSRWCAGCTTSSGSTPRAAPRTSASGCPNRTAQRRVPGDGDRDRPDDRRSPTRSTTRCARPCMAADVMTGNDQDCSAGSRRSASSRPVPARRRRAGRGRRGRRWADGARCRTGGDAEPRARPKARSSSSPRPAKRGRFDDGHDPAGRGARAGGRPRFGLRRARHLRPVPGRGRARGSSPSTASPRRAITSRRSARPERAIASAGARRRPTAGVPCPGVGDLVVDVPPESQIHRQVVRKEADAHPIAVDPVVRLHYVEVARARSRRSQRRSAAPARGTRPRLVARGPHV